MSYQVLARKWRPATFEQVVGQEHVLKALTHALQHNRLHHAYLFTGTRGVGKTSIARLLAKGLNCETGITATPCGTCNNCQEISQGRFVDLLEIDAASRTKVDDTREILDNVQYQPVRGRFKVYLIDEVHMLSRHSFNALLKTLEEPPEHVKFLLATTDPQKLPVTVLSRCLQFNLKSVLPQRIAAHLTKVLDAEQVGYQPAALDLIAQAADGSVRDGMSLTDQAIAHGAGELKLDQVQAMLGTLDSRYSLQLMNSLCQGDPASLLPILDEIDQFAPDYDELLRQMSALLHQAALAQFNLHPHSNNADADSVAQLASQLDREQVQLWYQILAQGRHDLGVAPNPRSGFEMVMLRALAFAPAIEIEPMQARQVKTTGIAIPPPPVAGAPAPAAAASVEQAVPASTSALESNVENAKAVEPKLSPVVEAHAAAKTEQVAPQAMEPEAKPAPKPQPELEVPSPVPVPVPVPAPAPVEPEPPVAQAPAPQAQQPQVAPDSYQDMDTGHYQDSDYDMAAEQAMFAEQQLLMSQAEDQVDYSQPASINAAPSPPVSQPHSQQPAQPQPVTTPTSVAPQLDSNDPMAMMKQVLKEEEEQRKHFGLDGESDQGKVEAAVSTAAPRTLKRPPAKPQPEAKKETVESAELDDLPPWQIENDPRDQSASVTQVKDAVGPELTPEPQPELKPEAKPEPKPEPLLPIGQRPVQLEDESAAVAKVQPAEAKQPNEPEQPLAVPSAAADAELDMQWYQSIGQLGIGARPRQLAINSVLERDGEQVVLNLIIEQRHLNSEAVVEPLQNALQELWQQPVQLRIEIGDKPQRETPIQIRRRRQREKLEQAKQDLYADPVVQWFQSEFEANLLEDSVSYQPIQG